MQERKLLKMDGLFSDDFFKPNKLNDTIVDVRFPLPDCPENLEYFFQTADGIKYKKEARALIRRLSGWALNQNIQTEGLESFEHSYFEYTGRDLAQNRYAFGVYHDGVTLLHNILLLLESGTVKQKYSRKVIYNLVTMISVCGPGLHTHIYNAFAALKTPGNLAAGWVGYRRRLAEQTALHLYAKQNISPRWEMHYVNAVVNRFADMLGVYSIEDEYVSGCDAQKVESVIKLFAKAIPSALTVDGLVKHHLSEFSIQELIEDVKKKSFSAALEMFEEKMDEVVGLEEEHIFLNTNDLIVLGEDNISYSVSWMADYIIYASIFNRLSNNQSCIDADRLRKIRTSMSLDDEYQINYFKNLSLWMASVYIPNVKDKRYYQPFLPWCIKYIALSSKDKKTKFNFIKSICHSDLHFKEMIAGLFKYLASPELNSAPDAEEQKNNLVSLLIELTVSKNLAMQMLLEKTLELDLVGPLVHASRGMGLIKKMSDSYLLLSMAIKKNRIALIRELCQQGVGTFGYDDAQKHHISALMLAAREGNIAAGEALLDGGVDINEWVSDNGLTALKMAAGHDKAAFCEMLLKRKAKMLLPSCRESNAIYAAVKYNAFAALRVLISYDQQDAKSASDSAGVTPLVCAVKKGELQTVRMLLEAGAQMTNVKLCLAYSHNASVTSVIQQVDQCDSSQHSQSNLKMLPPLLQAARAAAYLRMREMAFCPESLNFNHALLSLQSLDHFLSVFAAYRSSNPERVLALNTYAELLTKAYQDFNGDQSDKAHLMELKEVVSALSKLVKMDHLQNGFFVKRGVTTTSRLAKELDKVVNTENPGQNRPAPV